MVLVAQGAVFLKGFNYCDSQTGMLVTVDNKHREERYGEDKGSSNASTVTANSKYMP